MIKPTLLDRLIAAVSPSAGVRRLQSRMKFEALGRGYKGASRSRDALSGWSTPGQEADSDILDDLPDLRDRSGDLSRNNPIATSIINTKVTGVVGSGLKLHASIDREFLGLTDAQADELEAIAERSFRLWAESPNCDIERTLNFYEQQDLAWRSVLVGGDHFILETGTNIPEWPFRLALQHIAAARVSNRGLAVDTPTLVAGVRKTAAGAPIGYQVQDSAPGARRPSMTWTELDAYSPSGRKNVHHLFRKLSPGQVRGIPDLSPVIELLKQVGTYVDAETGAAVKNAFLAFLVKTETGEGLAGLGYEDWKGTRKDYYKDSPIAFKDGSTNVLGLFPDDSVESFDPNRPNTAFEPFVNAAWAQIGAAVELPLEVMTKRFQSSYSAARGALLQAIMFYTGRRAWLARKMCQPVYESFFHQEVLAQRIHAPGFLSDPMIRAAYCGAEWIGDAHGNIDETKAVAAADARVESGFSTRKRETAQLTGEDYDKVRLQREKERRQEGDQQPSDQGDDQSADDLDRADRDSMMEAA